MSSLRELLFLPAVEIVRLIAAGDVSAAEVVSAHLDQIARLNPGLNAFVDLRADDAMAEACAQDEAVAAGAPRGSIGGLPITIKSAIDVKGLRCETGSPSRLGTIAAADATVVARLRAAGAIVLGTTNVAEMLMGYESENPLHGRTVSPWDAARTPGGSSGGEAAAIAAGCSAGGIGSDGGGSIRVPAHFTGICGLKPTPGRLPWSGHQPPCLGPFALLGVVGPMARTVADLDALFRVAAGWDAIDPMAAPVPVAARDSPAPAVARIGVFEDDGRTPVTPETREAVRAAARSLEAAGHLVEPFRPAGLDRAREVWNVLFCEAGLLLLGETLGGTERALPILEAFLASAAPAPLTGARLLHAWADRDALRAEFLREMETFPILVCPVAAVPAFGHGERVWSIDRVPVGYLDAMSYTQWFNVLGNPVVVVPAGRSPEGLPIGVQVVGRPYEEERVLAIAGAIERGCGAFRAPSI